MDARGQQIANYSEAIAQQMEFEGAYQKRLDEAKAALASGKCTADEKSYFLDEKRFCSALLKEIKAQLKSLRSERKHLLEAAL